MPLGVGFQQVSHVRPGPVPGLPIPGYPHGCKPMTCPRHVNREPLRLAFRAREGVVVGWCVDRETTPSVSHFE